jgi:pyruvate/2-oxoglutarate dehydrogenase complex dihydrolipoamide dehydrogenase (E3) component
LSEGLLIVWGNVIDGEFATLFAEPGIRVTLLEMAGRILPGEEAEAAALLRQEMKKPGVAVRTDMRTETIRETGSGALPPGIRYPVRDKLLNSLQRNLLPGS